MSLLAIALLAAGDKIPFRTLSTASERDQVVHGQLPWQERFAAVMAYSLGRFAFPPLARTQLPRLLALPLNFLVAHGD